MERKFIVINVLPKASYDDCHIKGSINVPLNELENFVKTIDKNTEIIVYGKNSQCSIANQAWHLLNNLNFPKVEVYKQGLQGWYYHKYPLSGVCAVPFLREPNMPIDQDQQNIKIISAHDLKKKMEEHALFLNN